MSDRYVLEGHEPVAEPDLFAWGWWMETADRHVAQTIQGDVTVSTVFLGLDYSFGQGPPILFETMVFGTYDDRCMRYATWAEAEAGHRQMVREIFRPVPIVEVGQ